MNHVEWDLLSMLAVIVADWSIACRETATKGEGCLQDVGREHDIAKRCCNRSLGRYGPVK